MNMPQNTASSATNTASAAPKPSANNKAAPKAPKAAAPKKSASPVKATQKVRATKPSVSKPAVKPAAKAPAVKKQAAVPTKPLKDKKVKVVRDSFTIPKMELLQIGEMKKRALSLGVEIKKSELIRAGLSALAGMSDANFKKTIASVPTIKTGRPAKD